MKRRQFRFRTVEIISLMIFSVAATLLTVTVCDRDYAEALVRKYSESRSDIIYQVSEKIAQTCKGAHALSNSYFYSDYLDTMAEASENYLNQNIITFNGNMKTLDMAAMNLMIAYDFDYYIVMRFDNGYSYISKNKYLSTYDYDKWLSEEYSGAWTGNEGKLSLSGPYADYIGKEEHILVFGRTFFGSFRMKKGYFLVCIPEVEFSKEYETVAEHSNIYLLDKENRIISSNNKKCLGQMYSEFFEEDEKGRIICDNKEYLATDYYNEDIGITVVEHYPYENIVSAVGSVHSHVMFIVALIVAFIVIFAVIYADIMSRKLRKLSEEVGKVGEHNLDVTFSGGGWYEISQIAIALSAMQSRIKNLVKEIKEKEKRKRKAEIDFLQLQMNPHVIYNTVFCAKCLIDMGNREDASYMLAKFIEYLRWMFNSSGKNLTVLEACEHIEEYIEIMRYRYTDNFEVEYHIAEDTENAYMINMLLQPIVENAILHGIAPSGKKCRLVIETVHEGDRLLIRISNNGVGMTKMQLEQYEKQLKDTTQHHGMNNVLKRLQTTYSENYDLQIWSDEKETQVTITIPYLTAENMEEM